LDTPRPFPSLVNIKERRSVVPFWVWNDPAEIEDHLRLIATAGAKPAEHIFHSLADAYARQGNAPEVERVLSRMKADELKPGTYAYVALIAAYGNSGKAAEVHRSLERLQDDGVDVSDPVVFSLIKALAHKGTFEDLDALVEQLLQIGRDAVWVHNSILVHFAEEGKTSEAVAWFERVVADSRLAPDSDTYTAVIYGFSRLGKHDEMFE